MHEIADLTTSLPKVPEQKEHTQLGCQAAFHRDEKSTNTTHQPPPSPSTKPTKTRIQGPENHLKEVKVQSDKAHTGIVTTVINSFNAIFLKNT